MRHRTKTMFDRFRRISAVVVSVAGRSTDCMHALDETIERIGEYKNKTACRLW